MPEPEQWVVYQCKNPQLLVEYQSTTAGVRFTSKNSVVRTSVSPADGRINWKNFQAASSALGLVVPVKVVSVNASTLVIDGGAFENSECPVVVK